MPSGTVLTTFSAVDPDRFMQQAVRWAQAPRSPIGQRPRFPRVPRCPQAGRPSPGTAVGPGLRAHNRRGHRPAPLCSPRPAKWRGGPAPQDPCKVKRPVHPGDGQRPGRGSPEGGAWEGWAGGQEGSRLLPHTVPPADTRSCRTPLTGCTLTPPTARSARRPSSTESLSTSKTTSTRPPSWRLTTVRPGAGRGGRGEGGEQCWAAATGAPGSPSLAHGKQGLGLVPRVVGPGGHQGAGPGGGAGVHPAPELNCTTSGPQLETQALESPLLNRTALMLKRNQNWGRGTRPSCPLLALTPFQTPATLGPSRGAGRTPVRSPGGSEGARARALSHTEGPGQRRWPGGQQGSGGRLREMGLLRDTHGVSRSPGAGTRSLKVPLPKPGAPRSWWGIQPPLRRRGQGGAAKGRGAETRSPPSGGA